MLCQSQFSVVFSSVLDVTSVHSVDRQECLFSLPVNDKCLHCLMARALHNIKTSAARNHLLQIVLILPSLSSI